MRERKIRTFFCFALLSALVVFITGCYEVDEEILMSSDAVNVYNLPGPYYYDNNEGQLTITAVPNSNDYRFQQVLKSGSTTNGYLRLLPLGDDIYIVQIKQDNAKGYYIDFYRFTSDRRFTPLEPQQPVADIAKQYNVGVVEDYYFGATALLEGKRADILAFLRAHKNLNLAAPSDEPY